MYCFSLDIRGRTVGLDIAKVPIHRDGGRDDGMLILDLGHLEGLKVPNRAVVHDHLVDGDTKRIFEAHVELWGQGGDHTPLLTLPREEEKESELALVLVKTGTHRDGSSSRMKLSSGIKALALGYVAHQTSVDPEELEDATPLFEDEDEPRPALHFHLLKVPNGGLITLRGEVVQQVEEMIEGRPQEVEVRRTRTLIYRCEDGYVASVADVWDVESLDSLMTAGEEQNLFDLEADDFVPSSHHPLEQTRFFQVMDPEYDETAEAAH